MEPGIARLGSPLIALLNPTGYSCSGLCAGSIAGRCLITSLLFRVVWQSGGPCVLGPQVQLGKEKGEQPPEGNDF